MAKLIKEYEGGLEKRTLLFRGENITYTMEPTEYGTSGDAPCFMEQLKSKFSDLSQELLDNVDMLDCETDEDEIFAILGELDEVE